MTNKEWTTLINEENDIRDSTEATHSGVSEDQMLRARFDAFREGMIYAAKLINYEKSGKVMTRLDAKARVLIAMTKVETIP